MLDTLFNIAIESARYVWILAILLALPLLIPCWWKRIYPNTPLVGLLVLGATLTLVVPFWSPIAIGILYFDLLLFLVVVVDIFTLPATKAFSVSRKSPSIASLKKTHSVELVVNNESQRTYAIDIKDRIPENFDVHPAEFSYRLKGRARATSSYQLTPQERGNHELEGTTIRVRSWLGMWVRFMTYENTSTLHVYPDMKQLSEYAVLARTNRLSLMGVRRTRRVGQENEFERLRDYTPDDNYKFIDWRSTARRNKLTVKDFQTSQSQRLIFMIDCGRMMSNLSSGLSLLDHSLNSMLMLSYVALAQGDSVGMICFSDRVHSYLPPKGGMQQMNHFLHASYDRFPQLVESRYDEAFLHLATHCRKRSMVVLITSLIDEVNANQIEGYLSNTVGKHLPLAVLLRDHEMFDAADAPRRGEAEMYRSAAAANILSWRHSVLTDLVHRGVLALDVFPEDMTAPLVNSYLEAKARHLL